MNVRLAVINKNVWTFSHIALISYYIQRLPSSKISDLGFEHKLLCGVLHIRFQFMKSWDNNDRGIIKTWNNTIM